MPKSQKVINIFFSLSICLLFAGSVFIYQKVNDLSFTQPQIIEKQVETQEGSIDEIKKDLEDFVGQAIATISGSVQTITKTEIKEVKTETKKAPVTTYIPLGGTAVTTSTSWTDLKNAEVTVDFEGEYGKNIKVSWDAFLKVAHGNGIAYARLFDVNHGIAVTGSEISTTSGSSVQVSSGTIYPWAAKNTYRVQLKSLNSFEVTFDSGRIKISY